MGSKGNGRTHDLALYIRISERNCISENNTVDFIYFVCTKFLCTVVCFVVELFTILNYRCLCSQLLSGHVTRTRRVKLCVVVRHDELRDHANFSRQHTKIAAPELHLKTKYRISRRFCYHWCCQWELSERFSCVSDHLLEVFLEVFHKSNTTCQCVVFHHH